MAHTVYKKRVSSDPETTPLGEETIKFLFRKIKAFYPYYFAGSFAAALLCIYWIIIGRSNDIVYVLERIPSLLLVQRTGLFEKTYIGLAWYLSSMILAMAIVYPLVKKHYEIFTTLVAPIGGLLILGTIIKKTSTLGGASDWFGITYKSNLRALAEISLGTVCYEVSRRMKSISWSKYRKVCFSILAIVLIALSVVYTCSDNTRNYDGLFVIAMCYVIVIITSRVGYFGDKGAVYNNGVFTYLGSLSISLYMFQNIFRLLIPYLVSTSIKSYVLLVYGATLLWAMILERIIHCYKKKRVLRN